MKLLNKLIKNEFHKLIHKKSFYVVTFIFIMYVVLTNMIYLKLNELENNDAIDIVELQKKNNNLDLTKADELEEYIENLTIIKTEEIKNKYKDNNRKYLVTEYLSKIIKSQYENEYITKDPDLRIKLSKELEECQERIKYNDWQYYVKEKVHILEENKKNSQDELVTKRLDEYLNLADYRIENTISFDSENYLNNAIIAIETSLVEYTNLGSKEVKTKEEQKRFEELKKEYLKNKYILEHKVDINNNETLKQVLFNFTGEFELFIIIYIVMIAGSITSEEYNKGTIKYLLTKPYKRHTILSSKLLTVLISIPLILIFMVITEIIIGGLILGFSSLSIPVLIFNNSSGTLVSVSIIKYLVSMLLANYPVYLILAIFCFSISTIAASTSAAITLTFLTYLAGKIISNLVLVYNINILKYFISVHWNFEYLVNMTSNPYGFSFNSSLMVIIAYISVILCLTYIIFIKKDVKNI